MLSKMYGRFRTTGMVWALVAITLLEINIMLSLFLCPCTVCESELESKWSVTAHYYNEIPDRMCQNVVH